MEEIFKEEAAAALIRPCICTGRNACGEDEMKFLQCDLGSQVNCGVAILLVGKLITCIPNEFPLTKILAQSEVRSQLFNQFSNQNFNEIRKFWGQVN